VAETEYVTRAELAEVVQALREEMAALRRDLNAAVETLDNRLDGLEHAINRNTAVLGGAFFLVFVVELYILTKIGL
jgi:hypothetical protein